MTDRQYLNLRKALLAAARTNLHVVIVVSQIVDKFPGDDEALRQSIDHLAKLVDEQTDAVAEMVRE